MGFEGGREEEDQGRRGVGVGFGTGGVTEEAEMDEEEEEGEDAREDVGRIRTRKPGFGGSIDDDD